MFDSILVLIVCQLIGEALHQLLGAPLPGPVIGMFLLTALLLLRRSALPASLDGTADFLLRFMGLLFVPAGAGVMVALPLLGRQWLPVTVALIGSSLLSLAVTALVMHRLGGSGPAPRRTSKTVSAARTRAR